MSFLCEMCVYIIVRWHRDHAARGFWPRRSPSRSTPPPCVVPVRVVDEEPEKNVTHTVLLIAPALPASLIPHSAQQVR